MDLRDACLDLNSYEDEEEDEEDYLDGFRFNPFEDFQGNPVGFCETILSVTLTDEVKDMLNSAQRNPRTLAKSANGTGKTFAAACFAIYWFLVYPDAQVYTLAAPPEDNLRLLLWGEIGAIVEKNPHLFAGMKVSLASLHIERNKRSFITGLAIPQSQDASKRKARFSGKHAPHILFIADEGDAIPVEIYTAIESCMSGGVARLLVLFNPRAQSGPIYQMERHKRGKLVTLKAFNHPNVITGKDLIPGAVSRDMTVARIHEWTEPLIPGERPGEDCFEVPEFLVGCIVPKSEDEDYPALDGGYRRIIEQDFYVMVLGEYPAQAANQTFNRAWIHAAQTRWQLWVATYGERPPRNIRPTAGYDVAELGNDSNVVTFYFGSFMARQIVWKEEVDVEAAGNKAADLYFANNAEWVNVDATGIGAGAWARMKNRGCIAYRIMVGGNKDLKERDSDEYDNEPEGVELAGFYKIRDQMIWDFREWLRTDKGAMIPPDELLEEEMLACTHSKNLKGQIIICPTDEIAEKVGRSPDRLMSAAIKHAKQPGDKPGELGSTSYAYGASGGYGSNGRKPTGKAGLGM